MTRPLRHCQNKSSVFSEYLKEVIYGGIDGIVTTFAVVSGFAGAALSGDEATQLSFLIVLLFGLANLFADAASMGLGNFLSVRSEKELYLESRKCQKSALKTSPESERCDTIRILEGEGFATADAIKLADIYQRNEEYWLSFMMKHKQDFPDPRNENEIITALVTFCSFLLFGSIPLLPFIIQESGDPVVAFIFSAVGTFVALVMLGILKWKVIGSRLWTSLFEVALVGGTAAALAYFVGTFFAV